MRKENFILTVNGGSSSVKFAVFSHASAGHSGEDSPASGTGTNKHGDLRRIYTGQVERIGSPNAQLIARRVGDPSEDRRPVGAETHQHAARSIAEYIHRQLGRDAVGAIGHRVVHGGMKLLEHQLITPQVIAELRRAQPLDMSHLPREVALIEAFAEAFANIPQIACFDTVFHRDLPTVSKLLAIPRQLIEAGVRRFGFHGLSYSYLMERLAELAGAQVAAGRVILAHLGSGASMAAVHRGKPVDTTMAFTPAAGLVMATRPGDLDPGLLIYLLRQQKMSTDDLDEMISHRCGLLGVSGTSGDMRDLIAASTTDARADEAVELFCYQAKKYLCAFAGALGGLDTLVFAGGIGEHAAEVRWKICEGLDFVGLRLDESINSRGGDVISSDQSRVVVRVIATDEEIVIARIAGGMLDRAN